MIKLRGVGPLGGGESQHSFTQKAGIHAGSKGMMSGPRRVVVRVSASSRINPGRLSNQFHTGADRCTPTLPRWSLE